MSPEMMRAALLWTLQSLFALRVFGQILTGLYAPDWLPAWKAWHSGLLPYPVLLPLQLALLCWMTVVTTDNVRGSGRFCVVSDRARRRLRIIAALYAGVMLLRYGLTMAFLPEMRWLQGSIPIAFHLVLATYLAVLAIQVDQRHPRH